MKKIYFPVVRDDESTFPLTPEGACPVCGLITDLKEEHVQIHGGALLLEDASASGTQAATLVDNLQAFLFMDWETNHSDGISRYAELEIACDVKKGQFSLLFCSTKCLRSFLNTCVDKLEQEVKNGKSVSTLRHKE